MGRSQRHKVGVQGVNSDGQVRENDRAGNTLVPGNVGGPLKGSQVPGPQRNTVPQEGTIDDMNPAPPITATGPTTATGTAAGAVARVIATLTATGGTAPFTWSITNAGGLSANIVGAQLRTSADPAGTVGAHTVDMLCVDARGESLPLSCVVTLT